MGLRRSPRLTPAALAARRANALKCTGPKTVLGKAWSSMNGLRHGWDARNLRAKIERTGDKESLVLFDWIFTRFFELSEMKSEEDWNYHLRLAARIWCHITGRILLPRVRKGMAKGWVLEDHVYQYSGGVFRPRSLTLLDAKGVGVRFTNPLPSKRRRKRFAWLPEVEFIDPPPRLPRAKRVRKSKAGVKGAGAVPHRVAGSADPGVVRQSGSKGQEAKNVIGPKLESSAESATSAASLSPLLSLLAAVGLGDPNCSGRSPGLAERPSGVKLPGLSDPEFHCEFWDQLLDDDAEDDDPWHS